MKKMNSKLKEIDVFNQRYKKEEICFTDFDQDNYDRKIKICLKNVSFLFGEFYDLSNLEIIFGDVWIGCLVDIKNLKIIYGNAHFINSRVKYLDSLISIEGNASFGWSEVISLSGLKNIGGIADFRHSKKIDVSGLVSIAGTATFYCSEISDLSSLETVEGDLILCNSKVNNLSSLKDVKGRVFLDDWQAKLFGDMFVREGDYYRFVPENERGSFAEKN